MSSLSKLNFNSGVKTLVSATASNKQQVNALLNENKSNDHGLKLWQLGLLIGVPSALLAFYFVYFRNANNNKNKKNTNNESFKSNANTDKQTADGESYNNKEKKSVEKKADLTPEERIKNILDSIQDQNNEVKF